MMARRRILMPRFLRLLCAALALTASVDASAQKSPACKPSLDAMEKVITVDHSTTTEIDGRIVEGITSAGNSYLKVRDKWIKSPSSPQETLQREQENIREAKVYTCQALADSSVNGISALVVRAHSEGDSGIADVTLWISKSTGLPLKLEEDLVANGVKRHISNRYGYTNIHAPL
jgi:hypothetical protein